MFNSSIKMPKGVLSVQVIQSISTFSYAIIYSSLILYITKQLGYSQSAANSVMGVFLAFNFVLHLLGGIMGGSFLSNRALFFITTLLQTIGIAVLATSDSSNLFIGLSLFLIGCGINTTCLNNMLTQRFQNDDNRRDTAFFMNYAAMNVGFCAGFFISGFFDFASQYQNLFWASLCTNIITLLLTIFSWQSLKDKTTTLAKGTFSMAKNTRAMIALLITFILLPILVMCFQYSDLSNHLVMVISISMFFVILYIGSKQKTKAERQRINAFLILAVTSIIFWMIYFTGPMGITLFIKNNVDKSIGGFNVATQWIMNINSFVVITGAPLTALLISKLKSKGIHLSVTIQFIFAFIFLAASFFILSLGIVNSNQAGYVGLSWIILHLTLQAIGELLIGPVGYAMIGRLAPQHLQGLLMGTWMMVSGVSASLAHYLSNAMVKTEIINPLVTNNNYYHVFNQLGSWAILGALLLLALLPILKKQIDNTGDVINNPELVNAN